jgi:phage gpG-like protein
MITFRFRMQGDALKYLKEMEHRTSNRHLLNMQRNIVARVIHAEITYNFMVEARRRPVKWAPLSTVYAKIKNTSSPIKAPNKQPAFLGKYPTPWGNINIRTGRLFGELGTILRITPYSTYYGTITPYAEDVSRGKTTRQMDVNYVNKYGTEVKYRKKFRQPKRIPARPFDFVSQQALNAISISISDYITAPLGRKTIFIPQIKPTILAPGGRRVTII